MDPKQNPFAYNHTPTPQMIAEMEDFRSRFAELWDGMMALPSVDPRYMASAKTALEQSNQWLNKAITHAKPTE